jgi:NTP pyrophosphatase (non-canonical NTP hydrolase)
MLDFDTYQKLAHRTSGQNSRREILCMSSLGLCGESGEVADIIKKVLYHGHLLDENKIVKELGDILWYVAEMATGLGIELDFIAATNLRKLQARYPRGFSQERSINRSDE